MPNLPKMFIWLSSYLLAALGSQGIMRQRSLEKVMGGGEVDGGVKNKINLGF